MKPLVAITVGDMNGIGPEVVLRSIRNPAIRRLCTPVLVGPHAVFSAYARRLRVPLAVVPFRPGFPPPRGGTLHVESSSVPPEEIRPGVLSGVAGEAAARAILTAVRLARTKRVAAIVTAPVSKQALHLSGIQYPGQTEMLQDLSGSRHVAMMLVSKTMKIGLVTIHLPLAAVARALTHELLTDRLTVIRDAMRRDWGIPHPLLAVLGLNPHAGEGGDIGAEEQRVIIPVIEKLRKAGFRLEGPYPADGFFGRQDYTRYDAVVAMYHDQGLIPVKMTARNAAVNVSAGLTIVRTSPDHGTAFGLAGRNAADPASMREAITLAVTIAQRRSVRR